MKKIILFMLFTFFISALHAEYQLSFFIGDVTIEIKGKKIEPHVGMTLPPHACIITGKKSQAHIYDTTRGVVTSIPSNEKITISAIRETKQNAIPSVWNRLRKESPSVGITTAAAVRGNEEGQIALEWDDGTSSFSKDIPRQKEWKLFAEKKYVKVIGLTKNASDDDGMFLHGASLYYVNGIKNAKTIVPIFEKVLSKTNDNFLKTEIHKILAAINFEQGKYHDSWEYMRKVENNIPENKLGETGYYILTQSAFFTNRPDEGHLYLNKMRQYHPKSSLLDNIIVR